MLKQSRRDSASSDFSSAMPSMKPPGAPFGRFKIIPPKADSSLAALINAQVRGPSSAFLIHSSAGSCFELKNYNSSKVEFCLGLFEAPEGEMTLIPDEVYELDDLIKITVGENHACALSSSKEVYCWGDSVYGQVGVENGVNKYFSTPQKVLTNVIDIVALKYSTCALVKDEGVKCWGSNEYGELGIDSLQAYSEVPVSVANLTRDDYVFPFAASIARHICVYDESSEDIYCWGNGADKQNGSETYDNILVPRKIDIEKHAGKKKKMKK